VKDWQKEKLRITLEKFSKKEVLAMIDKLDPKFWSEEAKEEARKLVEGGK
jgi:hypothetical protein